MASNTANSSTSSSSKQTKKRKSLSDDRGAPSATTSNKISDQDLEMELAKLREDLAEKEKENLDLKQEIINLKSQQKAGTNGNDQDDDDDDDDLSDSEIEELDTSIPWNRSFMQLREYLKVNGDCNVPRKMPGGLGVWVKNQKLAYKCVKNGKKGRNISPERIAMLDGIGFHWGKDYATPPTWEESFEELQKYKKAMGNCNVHVDPKHPSPLAKWVCAQRNEYKLFRKGSISLLSLEQIGQLKEIGFKWKGPGPSHFG